MSRARHRALSLLGVLALCAASGAALGDEGPPKARAATSAAASDPWPKFSWLGYARGISRSWSASRDTPAMNMILLPRAGLMAGGEFAIVTLAFSSWTLRTGFAGFVELESDGETDSVNSGPLPSGSGKILWRGAYAYYAAIALDAIGRRICHRCALEATAQYRHESQHYTGSNYGDGGGEDVSEQPYVGDNVIIDVAFSQRAGSFYFVERAIGMWYLPDRSSYAGGPAADLHARWMGWPLAHPFLSLYAEYRAGDDIRGRAFPDAYRVRAITGLALPSSLGDILLYLSGDVGHRYGVRGLTEEATLGLGIRLALKAAPE